MRNLIFIFLLSISNTLNAQGTMQEYWENFSLQDKLKKHLKFSTVYGAVNGGTSVSDVKTFSILNGLETSVMMVQSLIIQMRLQ